jgi:spermidine synthase
MEWFEETLYPDIGQRFQVTKVVFREKTEHQDLVIFETPVLGRVLALDGVIQVTEGDEFVYHEMLTHVPLTAHGGPKRMLIVGGGDGGIAREALKHPLERVVMVEIDRAVVDLCTKYMPSVSGGAFSDKRLDLVIADGCKYVAETGERFDVIVVDSTDPQGPGEVLFTESFYRDCKRALAPGGVLCVQDGVPFLQPDELVMVNGRLRKIFADAYAYVAAIPTYYGGLMALGWATDDKALRHIKADVLRERFEKLGISTKYYTPDLHAGAFHPPRFIAEKLA